MLMIEALRLPPGRVRVIVASAMRTSRSRPGPCERLGLAIGFVSALAGCARSQREASQTESPSAPAAAPAPAATGAPSAPAQVELPREPAPGSGSEGESPENQVASCAADRDCRAFSHYCGGCFCVPLAKSSADLKCRGSRTSCVVDPCRAQRAVCRSGACTLVGEGEK
jgi:hypothetical protein